MTVEKDYIPKGFHDYAMHSEYQEIHRTTRLKKLDNWAIIITAPLFMIIALLIKFILFIMSSLGKNLVTLFLRIYFRFYFFTKGVYRGYTRQAPPKQINRPIVVLSVRSHSFSALFAYSWFKIPIVIPLYDFFYRYYPPGYKFFTLIGSFLRHISYSDAPLTNNMDNVKTLLRKGYPTMVHINHGYASYRAEKLLYLHKSIKELINMPVDIYLCRLNGFENYKMSSLRNPILVNVEYESLAEVLGDVSLEDTHASLIKISQYFGFNKYYLV